MELYFTSFEKGFRGRPTTTLPVILNKDLSRTHNLSLKTNQDLNHTRSLAEERDQWRSFIKHIAEIAEASRSDDQDAKGNYVKADNWLLMDSPFPTLLVVVIYLVAIHQGPKYMSQHKPFDLKPLLVIYNFGLVLLSLYMLFEFVMSSWAVSSFSKVCEPVDYSDSRVSARIFFVLRKKNNQITFLHVFHHSTMPLLWWMCTRFVGGGEAYFSATLNCGIHVLMYSYYMLSAFGPAMQPYLWWKRYMTGLQLVQFGLVLIKTISVIYLDCGYPVGHAYILVVYLVILIALFSNFYKQTYLKAPRTKREPLTAANGKADHDSINGHANGGSSHTSKKMQPRKTRRFD
ncbi:hypothetical protein EGW08_015339 [Elysia chlorotica]|uniref:Elongation of very long chain fatty acids protein n=1 Tax=Elysia chlorotica TaxID=188477 RepID=A0A433T5N7_ELYCH|nr:hypothetical protein EGW08_015339 [Elysia chlorotica]